MVDLVFLGVIVVIVGFAVIFVAAILAGRPKEKDENERKVEVKGGGVVMIGPIPIIFGSDAKWTSIAIVLAIILIVLTLILTQYRVY